VNWSDERYVKIYQRETLTVLSLDWDARSVLRALLLKLDGAGVIETGTMDPAEAVALQLRAPVDVVRKALPALLACGTLVEVRSGFLVPNFVAAQEATKTEARKKADQRQRAADQRRLAELLDSPSHDVPRSPALSRVVPLQPSPAQPPAQPSPARKRSAAPKKPKAQAELPQILPPPPPAPPREPSRGEFLFGIWTSHRDDMLEQLGVEATPDAVYGTAWLNKVFKGWFDLWADVPFKEKFAQLGLVTGAEFRCIQLFEAYLELDWPAKCVARVDGKDTETPQPYPFSALASEKVWRPLVAKLWPDEQPQAGAA